MKLTRVDALHRITTSLQTKVGSKVRNVHVQFTNEGTHLILSGRSLTYHAKQVAYHGLLDLIDEQGITLLQNLGIEQAPGIFNEIEVI